MIKTDSSRKLSEDEKTQWEHTFTGDWMTPEAMMEAYIEVSRILGKYEFIQRGIQFVGEAWIASNVAKLSNSHSVRLVSATELDFEMKLDNSVLRYEVTEADQPGRRRGDEYRNPQKSIQEYSPEKEAANASKMLSTAASKKASKNYPNDCGLVIYLNLRDHDYRQTEVESCMEDAVSSAVKEFREVIILWKERLYKFETST